MGFPPRVDAGIPHSIPSSIRVGYRDYRVEDWPANEASAERRFAECDRTNMVIRIREDLPVQLKAECALHEVLHAAWEMADIPGKADEERAVTGLSNVMCQVIRDNPDFVAYLQQALQP